MFRKGSQPVRFARLGSSTIKPQVYVVDDTPPPGEGLFPGTGWEAEDFEYDFGTDENTVGSPGDAGYDAKCVAKWNCVQRQWVGKSITLGIVAFHINGIDHVSFALNNGTAVEVSSVEYNATTSTYEYLVTVDLSRLSYSSGTFRIDAIVVPSTAGEPRKMEAMFQYKGASRPTVYVATDGDDATGDGSSGSPYQTIWGAVQGYASSIGGTTGSPAAIDGLTLLLAEGSYEYNGLGNVNGVNTESWLTIARSPGAAKANTKLVTPKSQSGRVAVDWVHLQDLTVDQTQNTQTIKEAGSSPTDGRKIWIDNCDMNGPGAIATTPEEFELARQTRPVLFNYFVQSFVTDTVVTGYGDGLLVVDYVRGCQVNLTLGDLWSYTHCIVNCSSVDCGDAAFGASGTHRDYLQFGNNQSEPTYIDNILVYNWSVTDSDGQCIYGMGTDVFYSNCAFVNCFTENTTAAKGWWARPTNHLLFWHFSHDSNFNFADIVDEDGNALWTNVDFRGCVFKRANYNAVTRGAPPEGWDDNFHDMHYESVGNSSTTWNFGNNVEGNVTTGDLGDDFYDAVLEDRVSPKVVIDDVAGNLRGSVPTIGAYESQPS
jgi:hypothetical protein